MLKHDWLRLLTDASGAVGVDRPTAGLYAGDTRYLMWSMLAASAVFIALASLALALGWGVVGVWAALDVLIAARLALLWPRFARRRWAVVGWN